MSLMIGEVTQERLEYQIERQSNQVVTLTSQRDAKEKANSRKRKCACGGTAGGLVNKHEPSRMDVKSLHQDRVRPVERRGEG